MSALRTGFKLLLFATAAVLVVLLLRHWMATKQYVFNKEDIAKLAKQYAGGSGSVTRCVLMWVGAKVDFAIIQLKDSNCLCSQDRTMNRPSPRWWWSSGRGDSGLSSQSEPLTLLFLGHAIKRLRDSARTWLVFTVILRECCG